MAAQPSIEVTYNFVLLNNPSRGDPRSAIVHTFTDRSLLVISLSSDVCTRSDPAPLVRWGVAEANERGWPTTCRQAICCAIDEYGYNVAENGVHIHDLNATILRCLGFDYHRLSYQYQGLEQQVTGPEEAHVPTEIPRSLKEAVGRPVFNDSSSFCILDWAEPTDGNTTGLDRRIGGPADARNDLLLEVR